MKGKLNPCFIRPFKELKQIGDLAYKFALPPVLFGVHNVFYILMLRKYISDPSYILNYELLEVKLHINLSYEEIPFRILDREVNELHKKEITLVKVF